MGNRPRASQAALVAGPPVVAVLLLSIVPTPLVFSVHNAVIADVDPECVGIDASAGTTVHFTWTAAAPVGVAVLDCTHNHVVFQGEGASGSSSFVAQDAVYEFGELCPSGPCVGTDFQVTFTGFGIPSLVGWIAADAAAGNL